MANYLAHRFDSYKEVIEASREGLQFDVPLYRTKFITCLQRGLFKAGLYKIPEIGPIFDERCDSLRMAAGLGVEEITDAGALIIDWRSGQPIGNIGGFSTEFPPKDFDLYAVSPSRLATYQMLIDQGARELIAHPHINRFLTEWPPKEA